MNPEDLQPETGTQASCSETAYRLVALGGCLVYYGTVALEILRTGRMRPGVLERFGRYDPALLQRLDAHQGPHVWIHATSMGESKVAMAVADELRRREPEAWVTVSTSTATGQLAARSSTQPPEMSIYYPVDLPGLVQKAVRRLRPHVYVIVEAEYFPHIMGAVRQQGVPVCVVNGSAPRLDGLFAHPRLLPYWRRGMQEVACFGVIDQTEAQRLADFHVPAGRIRVLGNVKQAAIKPLGSLEEKQELRRRAGISPSDQLIVAGCTHDSEEAPILKAFTSLLRGSQECRLVLVPRRLERLSAVQSVVARSGLSWSLHKGSPSRPDSQVTVIGDYGHLVEWYGAADVGIVCGSFVPGFGGHNPVEALGSGARIVYGPYMREGDATLAMEGRGYAVRAGSSNEIALALCKMLAVQPEAGQLEYAQEIAEVGRRAAGAYADLLCEMLERRRLSLAAAAPVA